MTLHVHACSDLLVDLNALADGELSGEALTRLVQHTQTCEGCSDYLETLRRMSELHRHQAALLEGSENEAALEGVAAGVDPGALLGKVLGRAVDDEWTALAKIFYELGKAYVLEGNTRQPQGTRKAVRVDRAPADIRRTEARARRHLARYDELERHGAEDARGALFRGRSRRLLGPSASAPALVKGRRFLEEALALEPGYDEARIYLGFQLLVSGRPDRARVEFRRVAAESGDHVLRLMAVQWLGNLHVNTGRLDDAVRYYEQVVSDDDAATEPRLFSAFVNLPVTCALRGRADEAISHFSKLVEAFPERVMQIRKHLDGMADFRRVMADDQAFGSALRDRVPSLFAAA